MDAQGTVAAAARHSKQCHQIHHHCTPLCIRILVELADPIHHAVQFSIALSHTDLIGVLDSIDSRDLPLPTGTMSATSTPSSSKTPSQSPSTSSTSSNTASLTEDSYRRPLRSLGRLRTRRHTRALQVRPRPTRSHHQLRPLLLVAVARPGRRCQRLRLRARCRPRSLQHAPHSIADADINEIAIVNAVRV